MYEKAGVSPAMLDYNMDHTCINAALWTTEGAFSLSMVDQFFAKASEKKNILDKNSDMS